MCGSGNQFFPFVSSVPELVTEAGIKNFESYIRRGKIFRFTRENFESRILLVRDHISSLEEILLRCLKFLRTNFQNIRVYTFQVQRGGEINQVLSKHRIYHREKYIWRCNLNYWRARVYEY